MKIEPSDPECRHQPHMMAIAGPTIGPVPAMEVVMPNTIDLLVGT